MLPEYFSCSTPDQRNPAIDMRPAIGSYQTYPIEN